VSGTLPEVLYARWYIEKGEGEGGEHDMFEEDENDDEEELGLWLVGAQCVSNKFSDITRVNYGRNPTGSRIK
jgi:hypothetical protein